LIYSKLKDETFLNKLEYIEINAVKKREEKSLIPLYPKGPEIITKCKFTYIFEKNT
jgi:hypothetical protein